MEVMLKNGGAGFISAVILDPSPSVACYCTGVHLFTNVCRPLIVTFSSVCNVKVWFYD